MLTCVAVRTVGCVRYPRKLLPSRTMLDGQINAKCGGCCCIPRGIDELDLGQSELDLVHEYSVGFVFRFSIFFFFCVDALTRSVKRQRHTHLSITAISFGRGILSFSHSRETDNGPAKISRRERGKKLFPALSDTAVK